MLGILPQVAKVGWVGLWGVGMGRGWALWRR